MKQLFTTLLTFIAINVHGQITFQERIYKLDGTGKYLSASLPMPQDRVLLSGPVDGACGWCGNNNFLLVNSNLDTIWTKKGSQTSRQEQDLTMTADKNGFVLGATIKNNSISVPAAYKDDMLLQRFNLNGQLVWSQSYNGRIDIGKAVLALPNGGFLLGGIGGEPSANKGFTIMRLDNQGNLIGRKSYSMDQYDMFNTMRFTHNGNIIAAGVTKKLTPEYHLKLMLLNQNGDSLKGTQLIITNPARSEGTRSPDNAVLSLTDGGFLVTGTLDTLTYSGLGMIVKVDSNLQLVWKYVHRSNPSTWRQYSRVKELSDGTIVALSYQADPHVSNQFWIEHFTANGQLIQSYPFTSNITNKLDAITLEALADSSFIIGGACYNLVSGSTHYGMYVAKVKIPGLAKAVTVTGVRQDFATEENFLEQNYPNPTASETFIPYNLPKNYKKASIIIREIATGREIRKYDLKRSESSLKVEVSNFSNGLYLYSLIVDENPIATKKLAVMK